MTRRSKETSSPSLNAATKKNARVKIKSASYETLVSGKPSQYLGSLDGYDRGFIFGWVQNSNSPETRVHVQLMSGSRVVAQGLAEHFRKDLLESGFGDGYYSFYLPLLAKAEPGSAGRISLVCDKEYLLETKHIVIPIDDNLSILLSGLDGPILNGVIKCHSVNEDAIGYRVLIDGELAGTGSAIYQGLNVHTISFVLPSTYFDGQAHCISVMLAGAEACQENLVEILSPIITPWTYLANGKDTSNQLYFSLPGAVTRRLTMLNEWVGFAIANNDLKVLDKAQSALKVLNEGYGNRTKFPKMELPKADKPDVSIVIPVHNKFELTYNCIASLILSHNNASFEVIVVDDVSNDETVNITDYVANLRVIVNKKNQGFLRNCNMAALQANGKYLAMLNNDTEVGPHWLDEMLDVFERFNRVGAVGAKLLYPDGKLQEAGGIVWGNGEPWNLGRDGNPYDPQWNYVRQVDFLSGAAVMIPKLVWEDVGGFSEEYTPCYYEDTDLCFKLRQASWQTYYTPHAEVVHFEGQSHGTDTTSGLKKHQLINAPKFRKKWVDAYQYNGDTGLENVWRHKDRGIRYRALVIDYATPQPDKDAGSYAAVQEMKLLQALGFKLTFIPENLAHFGTYTKTLQMQGVECLHAPFNSSIEQALHERGREFDLVYITRYTVAERYVDLVRQYAPRAKILFNNADLHFLRELRAALVKGDKNFSGPLATRDRELNVMQKVDAILSYNETEHAVITSHTLRADNIFKCPWVLKVKGHKTPFEKRSGIAFLGGYRHPPNSEAVEWFIENVMPLLRAQSKERITFNVYGSHLPERLKKLATDDILMHGYVESLDEVFETCRVFVAPLKSGAGIKGKVLDAISYGVPSVISPLATEGTQLIDSVHGTVAYTAADWAHQIIQINFDKSLWEKYSRNCLDLTKSKYSFNAGLSDLLKALDFLNFNLKVP